MENQDQPNIQPDYSFILNQPGENPQPLPPVGGKSHKKWIIIAVCLFVFIAGLTTVAIVANKSQNNIATNTVAEVPPSTNPVNKLLAAVKDKDYIQAASFLPGEENTKQSLADNMQELFAQMDMSTCKVSPLTGNKVGSFTDLTCRQAQNKYGLRISFTVAQDGGSPVILSYTVRADT